jgi:large subunit ribosomal protein L20
MVRVKTNVARHKRVKRVMKKAKGFFQGRHKNYRQALETVERAERYAFAHRRTRKRDFRRLWITRITAACKERDFSYSRFIQGLKKVACALDRKMLAEIAVVDPAAFDDLVNVARKAVGQ